jgi:hypothetical protein
VLSTRAAATRGIPMAVKGLLKAYLWGEESGSFVNDTTPA